MTLTMEQLKKLVEEEDLKYFLDPNRDALMMGVRGANGSYQLLVLLELEGRFLQFRSISYHLCPEGHEHLNKTLRLLGELNFTLRFLKFGWDPSDGEIAVYGDSWVEDGDLTQGQFARMVHAYLSIMDMNYSRIDATIRTGEDPGEVIPGGGGGPSGLPPELQELLDKLSEGSAEPDEDDDDEGGLDSW